MSIDLKLEEKTDKFWISTTGYRILLILKSLMEKALTIEELVEIVKKNKFTNKSFSKDTIRLDIVTLKSVGCQIKRPSKANKYKYELVYNPFVMLLSADELSALVEIRNNFVKDLSVEEIFALNNLYKKISQLTFNDYETDYIDNTRPLINIDKKIYKQLSNPKIRNKKIKIVYNSPKFGEELICVIPHKIVYENNKVYLWCFSERYNTNSLLNVERIKQIAEIDISQNYECFSLYNVIYELYADAKISYTKQDNETVIENNSDKMVINATVDNEFLFIQRMLQFGTNFKIISPNFFKEKLINKLKLIQKGYAE